MNRHTTSALPKGLRIVGSLFLALLSLPLNGCDGDDECTPQLEETIPAPDGRHVIQRWISICGFPGATVTDIVSVTEAAAPLPAEDAFAFNEEPSPNPAGSSVKASWSDATHVRIQVDGSGDVRFSPHRLGGVDVTYALGPNVDVNALRAQIYVSAEDRRQLERLKTSGAWHVVESSYDADAFVIRSNERFLDWVLENVDTSQ